MLPLMVQRNHCSVSASAAAAAGGWRRVGRAEVKEATRGWTPRAAFGCSLSVSSHKGEVFDAREPDFGFVF
jgi:hypothetical protein